MEKKTHEERIRYLELAVSGDNVIQGIKDRLDKIEEKIDNFQRSFSELNRKVDKMVWSYIVVGTVLMFIVYLVQTVDKLPAYMKPETKKESSK